MAASERPETHYAHAGDTAIAYQIFGSGPRDLIFVPGILSHVEQFWDDPHIAGFLTGLARGFRVIPFDKRGLGLSDRIDGGTPLATPIADVNTMMAAADSARGTVRPLRRQPDEHSLRRDLSGESGTPDPVRIHGEVLRR